MAASFTEDIFTEILKRLPVSSLIKFMLVQKSWYRLIQSPDFNKARYSYHQKNTAYIIFHSKKHLISLGVDDKPCKQYYSLPFPEETKLDEYMTVPGISNGLICLLYSKPLRIFLWNPIIRKYKTIPLFPLLDDDPPCRCFPKGLVFGYVPKMNDYKLINIVKYLDEGRKYQSNKAGVFVYSLSTDSWKIVDKDLFTKSKHFKHPVIVNGAAYWIGEVDQLRVIVCFDIENEIIREIMLPPEHYSNNSFQVTLVQNFSDLFLFDYIDEKTRIIDIWILGKEAGMEDVWTKKFTLDLDYIGHGTYWSPECFRNNNEIILTGVTGRYPYVYTSYDFEKGEQTEMVDDFSDSCSDLDIPIGQTICASVFVENLGLLGDKSKFSPAKW